MFFQYSINIMIKKCRKIKNKDKSFIEIKEMFKDYIEKYDDKSCNLFNTFEIDSLISKMSDEELQLFLISTF